MEELYIKATIPVKYKDVLYGISPLGHLQNGPIKCPICKGLIQEGSEVAAVKSSFVRSFPNVIIHATCVDIFCPEWTIELLEKDYKSYTELIEKYSYWYYKH